MDIVSLIEAPEPSSCAAMVCMPEKDRLCASTHPSTDQKRSTGFLLNLLYGTCPEGQAKHRLVHGVFKTKVWNDLEVVGGMKGIGCDTGRQEDDVRVMRYSAPSCLQHSYRESNVKTSLTNLFARG